MRVQQLPDLVRQRLEQQDLVEQVLLDRLDLDLVNNNSNHNNKNQRLVDLGPRQRQDKHLRLVLLPRRPLDLDNPLHKLLRLERLQVLLEDYLVQSLPRLVQLDSD